LFVGGCFTTENTFVIPHRAASSWSICTKMNYVKAAHTQMLVTR
jgi:hypothetical protein